jgi:hypothetical protein
MTTRQPHPLDPHDKAPLDEQDLARRNRLLIQLRGSLAQRRRHRRALHTSALAGVLSAVGAIFFLSNPLPTRTPTLIIDQPSPVGLQIRYVHTDPALPDKLAVTKPRTRIELADDQQLADLLRRAGSPGLIRVGGRVLLSSEASPVTPIPSDPPAVPHSQSGPAPDANKTRA